MKILYIQTVSSEEGLTMHMNQAEPTLSFPAQASEQSFSSVWGNEMQREDFLALAAGVRQFSVGLAQMGFVPGGRSYSSDGVQSTPE
jgi:hypothetical protein